MIGLLENNNGRACRLHSTCGLQVAFNSVLQLQPTFVKNADDENECAIGAYFMVDGTVKCLVGFVASEYHFFRLNYEHKLVQVVEG